MYNIYICCIIKRYRYASTGNFSVESFAFIYIHYMCNAKDEYKNETDYVNCGEYSWAPENIPIAIPYHGLLLRHLYDTCKLRKENKNMLTEPLLGHFDNMWLP